MKRLLTRPYDKSISRHSSFNSLAVKDNSTELINNLKKQASHNLIKNGETEITTKDNTLIANTI